jgi:hypothetical protein
MKSDTTLSLEKAVQTYPTFGDAVAGLDKFTAVLQTNPSFRTWLINTGNGERLPPNLKSDNQFISFQRQAGMLGRTDSSDRIFPLETVEILSHNTAHDANIEKALIHAGPSADEFARSLNALAVTVGSDIYFRNGSYKPESEEGRTILAHELTHVRQYEEKRITKNSSREELENEAVQEEQQELYDPDPYTSISIDGEVFMLRESELKKLAYEEAQEIKAWLTNQKTILSEQAYLNLLCKAEHWLHGGR